MMSAEDRRINTFESTKRNISNAMLAASNEGLCYIDVFSVFIREQLITTLLANGYKIRDPKNNIISGTVEEMDDHIQEYDQVTISW